jgi:tetratricopeptide (TPR) repeat protein
MLRSASILALTALIGFAVGCSKHEQAGANSSEDAYQALKTAWDDAQSSEAKVALAEDYLSRFPGSEHSGSMAWRIAYYRGQDLGDPAGAWAAIAAALPGIEDPEQRFEASMAGLSLADSTDVTLDLADVAAALGAVRPLSFDEHSQVASAAVALELWEVADQHSRAALELATPDRFRLDYPEREYTEQQIATRVKHRKTSQLVMSGWALFNLGATDEAFARFKEAEDVGSENYLGIPNNSLYQFWGRAALAEGDYTTAIDMLGAEAIFGQDREAAEPFLREAFAASTRGGESYEEFLWATRNRLAKTADDFELLDYQGTPHRLSDAAGKVILLAFWFPT